MPTYVARELIYDGKTIAGDTTALIANAENGDARVRAESALSRGVALSGAGDDAHAREMLDQALRFDGFAEQLRALALKTRGSSFASEAYLRWPVGDERDRLLMSALADFQSWKALAPKSSGAASAVAETLAALGAYDEAQDAYTIIYNTWPDDRYWTLIRIGAIFRARGQTAMALDTVDEIVAQQGTQAGMAYHYHRGWTLSDLGRTDEAVDEYTTGIANQPDYAWAYFRRACALADLGSLNQALSDQKRGTVLYQISKQGVVNTPSQEFDDRRVAAISKALESALRLGRPQRIRNLCDGFWNYGTDARERSKLLPGSL